jgi:hypothetical protein
MDMEIWLENLTANESLPENTNEPDSVVETMSMNKSVMRTASVSSTTSPALLANQTPVVTMAETATQKQPYNVIFCVDGRNIKDNDLVTFTEYTNQIKKDLSASSHSKIANSYTYIHNKTSSDNELDLAEMALMGLNSLGNNSSIETYIFIVTSDEKLLTTNRNAEYLTRRLSRGNNHLGLICNIKKSNDTSYIFRTINETGGEIVNLNRTEIFNSNEVSEIVLNILGAKISEMRFISSIGLTVLPPEFSKTNILNYYDEYENHLNKFLDDTDNDGIYNYEEIDFESSLIQRSGNGIHLPSIKDCLLWDGRGYVKQGYEALEKKYDNSPEQYDLWYSIISNVHILPILSDPTSKDGDGDGLIDGVSKVNKFVNGLPQIDSAPLCKGVYNDNLTDIVSGELTIISCDNNIIGHAFLVYESYIYESFNFNGFTAGYIRGSTVVTEPTNDYRVKPGDLISIGNAGGRVENYNDLAILEFSPELNDKDAGGVYYNREFALVLYKYNKFINGPDIIWDKVYDSNRALTTQIKYDGMAKIINICKEQNWYNVIDHSCVHLATACWNSVVPYNFEFGYNILPSSLMTDISKFQNSYIYDIINIVMDRYKQ